MTPTEQLIKAVESYFSSRDRMPPTMKKAIEAVEGDTATRVYKVSFERIIHMYIPVEASSPEGAEAYVTEMLGDDHLLQFGKVFNEEIENVQVLDGDRKGS